MKNLTKREIETVGKRAKALAERVAKWDDTLQAKGAQRHRYLYAYKLLDQALEQLRDLYREV